MEAFVVIKDSGQQIRDAQYDRAHDEGEHEVSESWQREAECIAVDDRIDCKSQKREDAYGDEPDVSREVLCSNRFPAPSVSG